MMTAATVTAAVRGQEKEQQPTQPPAASQSCRHRVPAVQEWDRRVAVTDPVTDEWLKVTEVQRPPQGHTARRRWCWDRGPCSRPLLQHRLLRPRPSPPRCGLPGTGAPSLVSVLSGGDTLGWGYSRDRRLWAGRGGVRGVSGSVRGCRWLSSSPIQETGVRAVSQDLRARLTSLAFAACA